MGVRKGGGASTGVCWNMSECHAGWQTSRREKLGEHSRGWAGPLPRGGEALGLEVWRSEGLEGAGPGCGRVPAEDEGRDGGGGGAEREGWVGVGWSNGAGGGNGQTAAD
jgi:hypothetical protein